MGARLESHNTPRYRFVRRFAAGGVAELFVGERARDSDRGRAGERVVLKRLLPHLRNDPEMAGMLRDEIRLGLACRHPNLVATLDSWAYQGQLHGVLEYIEGQDLRSLTAGLLANDDRFSLGEAVLVCLSLCRGLHHLHGLRVGASELSVVHRDVTPPNVLLGVDGSLKLCDLGFAKSKLQRTRTAPGLIKGKFSYLSPEAAHGEAIDARADVFAVGIVLWEMLTMRRLFHAPTDFGTVELVRRAEIPALLPLNDEADTVLQEIVGRALARDPDQRFQSAKDLHDALMAYADYRELDGDIAALVTRGRFGAAHQAVFALGSSAAAEQNHDEVETIW
ncbi:MAG: serine/threonine protein kinase [Myxococcales bacterium]|nr:serine/threonine protein kinase [Myxococcales bacterium]